MLSHGSLTRFDEVFDTGGGDFGAALGRISTLVVTTERLRPVVVQAESVRPVVVRQPKDLSCSIGNLPTAHNRVQIFCLAGEKSFGISSVEDNRVSGNACSGLAGWSTSPGYAQPPDVHVEPLWL